MTDYLTIKQAAKRLNLSERRVRQLCQTGEIEAEKYPPDLPERHSVWRIAADKLAYKRQRRPKGQRTLTTESTTIG